jgi:hypothetical protein
MASDILLPVFSFAGILLGGGGVWTYMTRRFDHR